MWYNCPADTQPLSNSWLEFWNGATISWGGNIRVDGLTYAWMGQYNLQNSTANVTDIKITPTRSIFTMQAGPMNVTVTFLTPIEPSDWVNQSTPFSYISVEAQSLDGAAHLVQFYTELSSEFVTGIRPQGDQGGGLVSWQSSRTATSIYHQTEPEQPQPYAEVADQAEDGKGYLATTLRPGLTWAISRDTQHPFINFGNLSNAEDSTTSGPLGKPWYDVAFAVDLGNIQSTPSPVTWAIGYVRDPVVQYSTSSGTIELRRPYWTTRYSDIDTLIDAFLADYPAALRRAIAFDEKVMGDASKISSEYVDLISLVARQVMGGLDITVGPGDVTDASDVKIFMKDIGSSESQRVNPVERMFAAFPAYLYLNASLGGALLAPLLDHQSNQSALPYAAQDIGTTYPNVTGTHGPHSQGVEQSGNMLVMMYAHARVSGDGSLLAQYYSTAKRWADYLVSNALTPSNQDTADGESNANLTNLAIKGIIGVKAMAEISRAVQEDSDAEYYDSQANSLSSSWLSLAQSSDQQHLLGQYGDQSSWAMMYNVYADLLLQTNLVSRDVLAKQTAYYQTLLQTEASPLGLPIDYVSALSKTASTAWTLLTSATVTDDGVRDQLIQYAWDRAATNKTTGKYPDVYDADTGDRVSSGGGVAGPALGAMFAHLALNVPNTTIVVPSAGTSRPNGAGTGNKSKSHVGAIAGGVVGGVVLLALIAGAGTLIYCKKRRGGRSQRSLSPHRRHKEEEGSLDLTLPYPFEGDTDASGGGTPPPFVGVRSSKAARERELERERERARLMHQHDRNMSSLSPLSEAGHSIPSSEQISTGASSLPSAFLTGLRSEVEHLRRLVQGLREDRMQPPPEYSSTTD
ncbi:hypothetical protein L226DRAFT_611194 [Lentinus tigrinus ALCF2SS1-7]|uniref:uncharacterized protein n=1 Tax=Lentinus tigrinus ALCF2SS1-7 TaxID=1328758 RepID=UPI0011661034|nr:hypothetical protein L226DRAFT_611194 [Lentinus tigrinus ALCF2SS1-7]